jgi:hypothetical protein
VERHALISAASVCTMNEGENPVCGEENREEGGASAAAAAAAAAAGLTSAAREQQAEQEAEKQAAEQEARATKRALDVARASGKQRAPYWQTLVPVLMPVSGKLKCMLKCIKGVEGVCGKILSTKNVAKSAKDHYTFHGCKGMRIEQGQAVLQAGPSSTPSVSSKRPCHQLFH